MKKKIKQCAIAISLISFSIFLINGCENTFKIQESTQVKNDVKETKSLIIPQYELIETPGYRELKQRVEKAQIEVTEIEVKRTELLQIYTEGYVSRQKISKDLKEAERKLFQLKTLLNAEEEKLERRLKNPPL
jgi:flagellar motility protein MotE (MotC chaperone)